jgi:multicomponent Na+:H+ antiporter subunit E
MVFTLSRISTRTMFLVVLWVIVSEGDVESLVVGVPLALLAALISLRMYPDRLSGWNLVGGLRFAVYFFTQSFMGGIDVAIRAMKPSLPLDPGNVFYRVRLPSMASRILFVNTVSLLPGTLSSELDGDVLVVHVLDKSRPVQADLALVEERVGGMFGFDLRAADRG